jgi:hypothetical protein
MASIVAEVAVDSCDARDLKGTRRKILGIIIINTIQRNITKICAHSSYIRLIA